MGIQALPNTTIRVLGASQVLNDPAAVIKELLDNALDARATSISIEISSNTLDSIQVRDNGHGIPPEDRHLAAKPHCTSKIGSEDDLKAIGGSSLGFRGEALASVAEMSGSLTISTRVEGEQVAIGLRISGQGEVLGQERASLPVGTTIKITDFVKAHPVRRQVALKNTEKCLKKIKQMLQSYAFARPHVRLSLRVLKAKHDKGNWMYAPKSGGNAEDAALKIVGAACASQCVWSVVESRGFFLQAFLPSVNADVSKFSNMGTFISVDLRPVSSARGTLKQILKIFREALKKAHKGFEGVKDPFLYLEIACPPASYDANVEPAKDDALFEDPEIVVEAARRLFDAVYPAPEPTSVLEEVDVFQSVPERRAPVLDEDDFVTSLEQHIHDRPPSPRIDHPGPQLLPDHSIDQLSIDLDDLVPSHEKTTKKRRAYRTNMYGCDEEDLELLDARPPTGRTEADFEELRQAQKDVNVSNPWVMAKMNASVRRREPVEDEIATLASATSELQSDHLMSQSRLPVDLEAPGLPTPRPSSPSPRSQNFHPSDHVPDIRLTRDGRLIGSQSLPAPQMHTSPSPFREGMEAQLPSQHRNRQPPTYDYTLSSEAAVPPTGTPLSAIPDFSARARRSPRKQLQQTQINTPFVSPVVNQLQREKVWFDHLEDEGQVRQRKPKNRHYQHRDNNGLVIQGELGDLVEDPRPLTPPRRNRDMRDYLTAAGSASSLIEGRNYPQQRRARSVGHTEKTAEEHDENTAPPTGILSGSGFMPASELAAMEARLGPIQPSKTRPTKRRKTSESRALREVSGNAAVLDEEGEEEYRSDTGSRTASRRRRTTDGNKVRRTKSSQLPLERVPAGQGVHQLIYNMSTDVRDISRRAGKIDEEQSLLCWEQSSISAYDAFASLTDSAEIQDLAATLNEVLTNRVSDGEMVQDLGQLVQDAFATHHNIAEIMEVVACA